MLLAAEVAEVVEEVEEVEGEEEAAGASLGWHSRKWSSIDWWRCSRRLRQWAQEEDPDLTTTFLAATSSPSCSISFESQQEKMLRRPARWK